MQKGRTQLEYCRVPGVNRLCLASHFELPSLHVVSSARKGLRFRKPCCLAFSSAGSRESPHQLQRFATLPAR
jgi:hypothetical protein